MNLKGRKKSFLLLITAGFLFFSALPLYAANEIEAGQIGGVSFNTWKKVWLNKTHSSTPIILVSPVSQNNGDNHPIPRVRNVTTESFEISACVDKGERNCDSNALPETFDYMVWDSDWVARTNGVYGTEVGSVSTNFYKNIQINGLQNGSHFFLSPHTNNLGSIIAGVFRVEQYNNTKLTIRGCSHQYGKGRFSNICGPILTPENVGLIAIDDSAFSYPNLHLGKIEVSSNQWENITYPAYQQPRIISTIMDKTKHASFPKYGQVNNVGNSVAQVRICEADGANECDSSHPAEWLQYMILPDNSHQQLTLISPNSYTITAKIKDTDFTVEHQFSDFFGVKDESGYNPGRYTTISMTDFVGPSTISSSKIQFKATGLSKISGNDNSRVQLSPDLATYQDISSPKTFIQRQQGNNGLITGSYGVKPWLKTSFPAFMSPGTYKGQIVITLYENEKVITL